MQFIVMLLFLDRKIVRWMDGWMDGLIDEYNVCSFILEV